MRRFGAGGAGGIVEESGRAPWQPGDRKSHKVLLRRPPLVLRSAACDTPAPNNNLWGYFSPGYSLLTTGDLRLITSDVA